MVRKEAWGSRALLQAPGRQQPSSLPLAWTKLPRTVPVGNGRQGGRCG